MANLVGQQLGTYRLTRLLGQGGFADVYLGEHTHLSTQAAIKVLRTQLTGEDIENFRNEARTIAQLRHANIVRVLDFNVEGNTPFLVMDYALNGTLRQRHPRGTPLPVATILPYVKQMAAALQYAHDRKFIHRDVKPENMLLGSENEVLLSDFGIAVMTPSARPGGLQGQSQTVGWDPIGTVVYMAPEQIQGRTVLASDQYALAVVVYEWLTGVLPFRGSYIEVVTQQVNAPPPPLREKAASLSPDVEQVVMMALAKDPLRRFGSVQAFATALEQAVRPVSPPVVFPPSDAAKMLSPEGRAMEALQASLIGSTGRIPLGVARITIGRAPDNQLVLNNDPKVSSHHAELRLEAQSYIVVDLGSTNHTFVNGQELYRNSPHVLRHGDSIRFGDTQFTYEVSNALQKPPIISDGSTVRAEAGPAVPMGSMGPAGGVGNAEQFGTNYGGATSDADATYLKPQNSYSAPPLQPGYLPAQLPPTSYPPMPSAQPVQSMPSVQPMPPVHPIPSGLPQNQPNQPYNPTVYAPSPQDPQQFYQRSQYGTGGGGNVPNAPPRFGPPPQRRKLSVGLIILVALAVLIIIGSGSFFLINHNNQVTNDNAHATSTASIQTQVARNKGTAVAHAATAVVHATATFIAQATATFIAQYPNPYPPRTGKIVFFDPLTDASSVAANGWDQNATTCQFRTGYHATETSQHALVVCNAHNTNFANFAYRVVMTIANGDCGGLAFRSDKRNQNFYMYEVCVDGTFSLLTYRAAAGGGASGIYLINHQSNAAINKGTGSNQSNLIAVVAKGSTIDLYANNALLGSQNDPTYASGEIGLGADNYTSASTDIQYTDARVWNLDL
jgi:serine/threonine protein kinase